jgi:hypothetical protein
MEKDGEIERKNKKRLYNMRHRTKQKQRLLNEPEKTTPVDAYSIAESVADYSDEEKQSGEISKQLLQQYMAEIMANREQQASGGGKNDIFYVSAMMVLGVITSYILGKPQLISKIQEYISLFMSNILPNMSNVLPNMELKKETEEKNVSPGENEQEISPTPSLSQISVS